MRYSLMSFSFPKLPLAEALAYAARLGYEGLEPRPGWNHAHGIELATDVAGRARLKAMVKDSGMTLSALAPGCRFAIPAKLEKQLAEAAAYIDLAADVGAPRLRVFGGELDPSIERDTAIKNVAEALKSLVPQARARGITLCMETHDSWTSPDHVVAVLERVNDPCVRAVWDIMHPVRTSGWTMRTAWERLRPWIDHVHVHDGSLDQTKLIFAPIGQGEYDVREALACLAEMDYQGFVSGEWIDCESIIDPGVELASMRALESSHRP